MSANITVATERGSASETIAKIPGHVAYTVLYAHNVCMNHNKKQACDHACTPTNRDVGRAMGWEKCTSTQQRAKYL